MPAMTNEERNEADAVPAQAGISVFQQPDRALLINAYFHQHRL
jgi:hypothetical protein